MPKTCDDDAAASLLYAYKHMLLQDDDVDDEKEAMTKGGDSDSRTVEDNGGFKDSSLWGDASSSCCSLSRQSVDDDNASNRATLWMTCNHGDTILQDLEAFFGMAEKQLECKLAVRKKKNEQASSSFGSSAVEFVEVWKQFSKEGKNGRHHISGSVKGQGHDNCEEIGRAHV